MPLRTINSSERPTFVERPNMRFATSALSHEYRDYAINGEMIMDKMTGEFFIKRPADGRVLSFDQNKKQMYDLMLELRILLTTNENFTYPARKASIDDASTPDEEYMIERNKEAYYVSTNYDLVTINKEKLNDVLIENNTVIEEKTESNDLRNTLSFNISGKTNGFFCNPITRDSDKAAVRILSGIYNRVVTSGDPAVQSEYDSYYTLQSVGNTYADSDAILSYKVIVTNGGSTITYPAAGYYADYVRLNEERCIQFPDEMMQNFPSGFTSAKVVIGGLTYRKMHYVINNTPGLTELETIATDIKEYLSLDEKVYVNYFHVGYFVDRYQDIELLGNDVINGCIDIPYMHRYMQKMASLRQSATFIQSSLRPDEYEWGVNAVWAETVKNIGYNGSVINKNSETDIKELETYIAKMNRNMLAFNTNGEYRDDIFVNEEEP